MNFTDREKELLLSNAVVYSRITLYDDDGSVLQVFNENDYLVNWEYEDYRYVPDQGFIGQFVERLLDGVLMNVPDNISLVDKEIEVEIAVKDDELEEQVYHSYGRFIITKCEKEDTTGNYKFESSDYTKMFNIAFDEGGTAYPCLAIDLLNNAVNEVGVDIAGDDFCFCYAVPQEGLSAGDYCFSTYVGDTLTYMNFTTIDNLSFRDSLMLVVSKNAVIQRTVDSEYNVIEKEIPYTSSETQVGDLLSSEPLHYIDFINNNFVIEDNQFEEGNSCRDVICAIAKLGYTWARIGVDNKLYLDFVKKSESDIDEYDEIDTDKYFEATATGDTLAPINKVLIGMSQVEGENIYCSQENDLITLDKLKGETSQDTYTGKNLCGIPDQTFTHNGVSVTIKNGEITLNGTANNTGTKAITPIKTTTINGSYTSSVRYVSGTAPTSNVGNFNIRNASDSSIISGTQVSYGSSDRQVQFSVNTDTSIVFGIYVQNGNVYSNYKFKPQLELGSSMTNYEQYVGGTPSPNPDYPQQVKTVSGYNNVKISGKNLFDKDNYQYLNAGFNTGTVNTLTSNATAYTIYIPCNPNTTYTFTKSLGARFFVGYTTTTPALNVEVLGRAGANDSTQWTITTGNDAKYLVTLVYNSSVDTGLTLSEVLETLQIEKGSTATDYEEYQSQEFEIDLGKNLFDWENESQILTGVNINVDTRKLYNDNTCKIAYCKCEPNTTYTISRRAPMTNRFIIATSTDKPASGVDLLSVNAIFNDTTTSQTITTGTNANYIIIRFINNVSSDDYDTYAKTIQVEKGSVATEYAPYFTVCKNLFNKDNVLEGYNIYTDGSAVAQAAINSLNYTKIKPNTTYTVSGLTIRNTAFYDENKEFIDYVANEYTFTTPANARYLRTGFVSTSSWARAQLEEGDTATPYEPYENGVELYKIGDNQDYIFKDVDNKWYIYRVIQKINMTDITTISRVNSWANETAFYGDVPYLHGVTQYSTLSQLYCNRLISDTPANIAASAKNKIGLGYNGDRVYFSIDGITTKADYETYFANKPTYLYYILETPRTIEITYQPLIDQLNTIQNIPSYVGNMYITSTGVDINAPLDINVMDLNKNITTYSGSDITFIGHEYPESAIKIYDNPLTHSEELRRIAINGADKLYGLTYTPMTINSIGHPWLNGDDYIKITNLSNETFYSYPFDRKITYSGYLLTDLSSTAETKTREKYENPNNILSRVSHTEIDVDKANQRIDLLVQQTGENSQNITEMQLDINGINTTVSHIENVEMTEIQTQLTQVNTTMNSIANLFQITGGINTLRNSAFLLNDEVWEFTDNGNNPYHTPLGDSYDTSLAGTTVSVAEIKFRAIKIKSKSENITNLKNDGTRYTFNFYHKQDNDMVTTIKMYSTEDNTVKAFDDIVINGQTNLTNYEVSFVPEYTNYTIEIISDSTANIGYSYLYDMMLNSGDKQAWQPASDEIYSTTLKMSRLGLQVYSVGDGTITLLGSDGLVTYETTDGKTLGRIVSKRTIDGDRTRTVTTQSVYLVSDSSDLSDNNRWVETLINISGSKYKVEYVESGD